jgi:hypothetical protein
MMRWMWTVEVPSVLTPQPCLPAYQHRQRQHLHLHLHLYLHLSPHSHLHLQLQLQLHRRLLHPRQRLHRQPMRRLEAHRHPHPPWERDACPSDAGEWR